MGEFEKIFAEFFEIPEEDIHDDIKYQEIEKWDSLNHLNFVSKLEEKYDIELDMDDIIDMSSVKKMKEILQKYKVQL